MWTRAQLKANAKYAMRGRYGKCLLASLAADAIPILYSLLITIVTYATIIPFYIQIFQEPEATQTEEWAWGVMRTMNDLNTRVNASQFFYFILSIFVVMPLTVSAARFFVHNRFGHVDLGLIKTAFTASYSRSMGAMFVTNLFISLWTLLLVVPGIVKQCEYFMVPWLLSDNPNLTGERAREISRMMTDGQKWNIFVLQLSFLGWYLLGSLALGVGIVFVNPYYRATCAELYVCLRQNILQSGCVTPAELNLAPPTPWPPVTPTR